MSTSWPRVGRCGACGRAAVEFPSRNWKHVDGPCRARSQTSWTPGDVDIRKACRFIPVGQALPAEPNKVYVHSESGETVREYLARTAEEANR